MTKKKVLQAVWTWFKHHPLSTIMVLVGIVTAGYCLIVYGKPKDAFFSLLFILLIAAFVCFLEVALRVFYFMTSTIWDDFVDTFIRVEKRKKRKKR